MAPSESGSKSGAEVEFREIPLSIMRIGERYDFDIYLRIREEYHIFAARGAFFSGQHSRLMREGVDKLYVRADDWDKIEEFKLKYLNSILTDPGVSAREKAEVAFSTSMKTIREVFEAVEPRSIGNVEKNSVEMVKIILSDDQVMDNLIWINSHDHYTYQHSVRVGIYATALSVRLFSSKLSRKELASLSAGYFLHDIGMAQVPLKILDKRTPLTPAEWGVIRMHPVWGHDRLLETGHLTHDAAAIVLSHHERLNGSGYPFAREGDSIPVHAKICAIADMFESLTAKRPYRESREPFKALKVMQGEMPEDFDPELFKAFIMLLGPGSPNSAS